MTRHYHLVNGMEMAVLAEVTKQLHAAGYSSTLDLVYSVAQKALDRLPPLYFSIKPLRTASAETSVGSNAGTETKDATRAKIGRTENSSSGSSECQLSKQTSSQKRAILKGLASQPTSRSTPVQPRNRALTTVQRRQMKLAVQQAIQSLAQRTGHAPLPHEFWYSPLPWNAQKSEDGDLPTQCYYG